MTDETKLLHLFETAIGGICLNGIMTGPECEGILALARIGAMVKPIFDAHEQYKQDCPNCEHDPVYEAIEKAILSALPAPNSTGEK